MLNRREFLKVTAAAAPMLISAKALGRTGPGANETLNIGLIGLGGRCRHLMGPCKQIPGMRVVAICDCFQPRIDGFREHLPEGQECKEYTDFRRMFDQEKLDGVMVETTTHARAWVTCHAMAAGLDVYIEKPMCLTIAEGRQMVQIARKYGRVTQVGTQQRSMPLNNWASDLVKNGAIGKVTSVLAPNFVSPVRWEPKPAQDMPEGGDEGWWDIWTNQAEMRPYHGDLHTGWGRWWDYDGGGLSFGVTGWGTHSYDQINRGLGTDDTGPTRVVLEEAVEDKPAGAFEEREIGPDETGSNFYHMVKTTTGPRAKVRMKFAKGPELLFHLDADHGPGLGCIFVGKKGRIEINRDRIAGDPKELLESPDRPAPLSVEESQPHIENWLECIKSREKCTADIEAGQRSSTLCYLVNIARELGRVGETLKWDPVAERFTNSEEANALLSRPRRAGYELPA